MASHLDPQALAVFVAVAETGSFSLAAAQLGRTQSTVSAQIARLEQDLHVKLFERTTRSVAITERGEQVLADARRLLKLEAEILDRYARPPIEGMVSLGASDDLASGHALAALATRFTRSHPRVQLTVVVGNGSALVKQVRAGQLDLAITKEQTPPAGAAVLWRDRIVWVAAPGFDAAVAELPLAVFPAPCVYRTEATSRLTACDRPWRIVYESPSFNGLIAAVRDGIAVSPMAERLVAGRKLAVIEDRVLPALGSFSVVLVRGRKRSPATDAIVAHLTRSTA